MIGFIDYNFFVYDLEKDLVIGNGNKKNVVYTWPSTDTDTKNFILIFL